MLEIFKLADFKISKHELSAFLENPGIKIIESARTKSLETFLTDFKKDSSKVLNNFY